MDIKLTNAARAALKAALRPHAKSWGIRLDTATKAELLKYAADAGIDVVALADAADSEATADALASNPAVIAETGEPVALVTEDAPEDAAPLPEIQADIDAVLGAWRDMDTEGFKMRLADLAARAHKPAQTIIERIEVTASGEVIAPAKVQAARTGSTTAAELFGPLAQGALGKIKLAIWNAGDAPAIDPNYVWPKATAIVVSQLFKRHKPVMLWGPAGTGKTTFAAQLAANLKRPFVRISCNAQTDAPTLTGMTAPAVGGGTVWRDGQLTGALRTAGAIVLIDEPSTARPGALYVLQSVLDSRELHIEETGEVVRAADGVLFILADNTNGTGDASGQYVASSQLSEATIDRPGATVRIDYLAPNKEASVIVAKTGCPQALADLVVSYAGITRAKAATGELPHGVGLRRLLSWAEMLCDGAEPDDAAEAAFLDRASPERAEVLRQLLATHANKSQIRSALKGKATVAAPDATTSTGFAPVQE